VEPRVELPPDVDETWSALAKIPERRRVALVLRFYEDLPVAEIAALMDCRTGTVTSLIHRGLESMREVLA
jgi:RNA polymerase sigma factor (sigma-70 family)